MKIKLKKEDLSSVELSWLCIKPMLLAVRGKDLPTKLEMYQQLNQGQQGLFMFFSFHNHASTIEEFYWFSSYYINELKSWSGIKSGVRYYKDTEMVELLDQIELFVLREAKEKSQKVSPTDLETNEELLKEVKGYFNRYKELSINTIDTMNKWIIHNQRDFCETQNDL
ncbi:hypothetical protein [Cohnella sp.]|uniref:hypothetical protein n=1 Tax=Cohnella sp. TaxID=1883426 RepID=UPI003563A207